MKKLLIACIVVVSSVAAVAAPAKKSKPAALTDSQMQSVKGQGTVYVFVFNEYQQAYYLNETIDTGPTGPTSTIVIGGPNSGSYPGYYVP